MTNAVIIADIKSKNDPKTFYYRSVAPKKDHFKEDHRKYRLSDLEWTFHCCNMDKVFDSETLLQCRTGATPVLDIFTDEERASFNSAKKELNELEDLRCEKNDRAM